MPTRKGAPGGQAIVLPLTGQTQGNNHPYIIRDLNHRLSVLEVSALPMKPPGDVFSNIKDIKEK